MAGWTLKPLDSQKKGLVSRIQKNIRYLGIFGMNWSEELLKHSKSIGITESQLDSMYGLYYQSGAYPGTDYGQKEFIAFYDKEYPTRRDFLRKFAMNGEVEHVLEIISDESIIYDQNNYFAYPNTRFLKSILKEDKSKEIVDDLNESYKKVYHAFGFNEGHDGWHYLKKFLIDGFLAYEIIYDENEDEKAKNVIGFKELDPTSLEPEIRIDENENEYRVWVQYRGDIEKQRELLDSNLIYISWARGNFISRLSYVERLVRSFNMLRTLENSRIIWNVWNAQMRVKITVPIGTQSEQKARQRLSQLRGMYKEELQIDDQSGEITYNGQPNFPFAKTFMIPSRNGEATDVDGFEPKGYDLSDTQALEYFWKRFIIETKVPYSRFSNMPSSNDNEGGGSMDASGDSIEREEMRFQNFINRIRAMFQEILLKPTWMQFVLKHPEFKEDQHLRGSIGLDYIEENFFKQIKERKIAESGAKTVGDLMNIKETIVDNDGNITETPFFDPKFLVEKYMNLSDNDIKLNEKYKKSRNDEINKLLQAQKYTKDEEGGEESETGYGGNFGDEFGGEDEFGGGDEFGGEDEF